MHRTGLILCLITLLPMDCIRPGDSSSSAPFPDSSRSALSTFLPYDFSNPEAQFILPASLNEISGLTLLDTMQLAAVQDEDGRIFRIALETGQVTGSAKFASKGDYEGIERVGDRLFVLESNGTLYEVKHPFTEGQKVRKHRTWLSSRYDTEGLAYDPVGHRLLIACKEYPGKGMKRTRTIYAFDPDTGHLDKAPAFKIDFEEMQHAVSRDTSPTQRLRDFLDPLVDIQHFKPSALAMHPLTGAYLVLSSVLKVVVVVSPDGTISDVWPLPGALFPQPEGLAILPNGDLFISNEGRPATLLRFHHLDATR